MTSSSQMVRFDAIVDIGDPIAPSTHLYLPPTGLPRPNLLKTFLVIVRWGNCERFQSRPLKRKCLGLERDWVECTIHFHWNDEVRLLMQLCVHLVDGWETTTINESETKKRTWKIIFWIFCLHLLYLKVYIYRAMTPSLLLLLLLLFSSFSRSKRTSTLHTPPGYKFQIPRYCGKKPMALCVCSSARLSSFSLSLSLLVCALFLTPRGFSMTSAVSQIIINKKKKRKNPAWCRHRAGPHQHVELPFK